ncbi:unnamed protein product [Ostreobium quekettii]|uniref:Equilibrative nucleoside transporter n=2 Tax=Ostreobium quekettii TaxID=121088 RepID=A0A8S1J804_9CHLO|nr:unnamed protein product [Ostreobium quekettii]
MGRDGPAPKDKGGLVYLCFFLFGAGLLAPWNAFITAVDYFNYLWPEGQMDRKFSVVYLPVMLLTLLIMLIWHNERTATARVFCGFSTYTVIMALMATPLISMVSRGGSSLSQYVPLGASAVIGVVDGLAEPAIVGEAGYLPEVYMQGFLFGTASAGTIISLLRIATKVSFGEGPDGLQNSTILYFSLASGLCAACLILHRVVLPKQMFFRHYRDRECDRGTPVPFCPVISEALRSSALDSRCPQLTGRWHPTIAPSGPERRVW